MLIIKKFTLFCIDVIRNYWHQPAIQKELQRLDTPVVFDVGAHEGETIDYLLKIKNIKKIHSFEPQVSSFEILKKKYKKNKKIFLNNIALSKENKKKIFYINNDLSCTSTFSKINKKSLWFKVKNRLISKKNIIQNTIAIKTLTLDNYIKSRNIKNIDLLKIDTEGHELDVLKGSFESLKKNKIKYILIELHFHKMYKNYSKKKIENFLKKNGFLLIKKFKFPFHPFSDYLYKLSN